jgi:RimJ/RimL family protein N-acetyltransferase
VTARPLLAPDYPVATGRLHLRPLDLADVDAVLDYRRRPEVVRYLYHEAWGPDEARAWLEQRAGDTAIAREGDRLRLAVVLAASGELIGDVMLAWRSAEHAVGEVGYTLNPDFGGRGYATEAAAAMLPLGFDGLGLHRIEGRLDARNGPSARVLERLGLRREAHLRENEWVKGEWTDELIYALLAHEWRGRKSGSCVRGRMQG